MIKGAALGVILTSACLFGLISQGIARTAKPPAVSQGFDPSQSISFYKAECAQSKRHAPEVIFNFADDTGIAKLILSTGQNDFYQYNGVPMIERGRKDKLTVQYSVTGKRGDGTLSFIIPKKQNISVNQDNTAFYRTGQIIEKAGRQVTTYSCSFKSPVSKTFPNPPTLEDLVGD